MALTVVWWNGIKKVEGKGAPSTGLGALLKKYESSRATLTKTKTTGNCDLATTALKAVDTNRKKWIPLLKDKWPALSGKLNDMTRYINEANEEIQSAADDLGLGAKMEKAGSQAEAVYEALWQTFEKQRDSLASAKSRLLFKSALATLDKLQTQADVTGDSDIYLKPKYVKQGKVIAGIIVTTQQQEQTYIGAINACIKARRDLLVVLKSPRAVLDQATTQVKGLKQKALDAQAQAQTDELAKIKKAVGMIVRGAAAKVDEVTQAFAPGTVVRDSTDVKAAKLHPEDAKDDIVPLSSELFTVNKANLAGKKDLIALAQEVALIV